MKPYLAIILLTLSVSACESGGETSSTTSTVDTGKDLFSNWSYQSASQTVSLDFRGVTFGSQPYFLYLSGGGACGCMMNIAGSQTSGTIVMASCVYSSLGTGGADPGCASIDGAFTYTKTADTLSICDGAGCETYQ